MPISRVAREFYKDWQSFADLVITKFQYYFFNKQHLKNNREIAKSAFTL